MDLSLVSFPQDGVDDLAKYIVGVASINTRKIWGFFQKLRCDEENIHDSTVTAMLTIAKLYLIETLKEEFPGSDDKDPNDTWVLGITKGGNVYWVKFDHETGNFLQPFLNEKSAFHIN